MQLIMYIGACYFIGLGFGAIMTSLGMPLLIQILCAIPLVIVVKRLFEGVDQ